MNIKNGLAAGGAVAFWKRVIVEAMPGMARSAPPGSQVLEVGYGDGLLSCFLCRELGWRLVGLDVRPQAREMATANSRRFFTKENSPDFQLCAPHETRRHTGVYDAVFIKTVLYVSPDREEYARWLDWIRSMLKPGGVFINFETGQGGKLMRFYRKLRRREYTDLCLYNPDIETLYDTRFEVMERRYYGGWSQFLAAIPLLGRAAAKLETAWRRRDAGHCFLAAILARRPSENG